MILMASTWSAALAQARVREPHHLRRELQHRRGHLLLPRERGGDRHVLVEQREVEKCAGTRA